jgi:hypothetical protein
MDMPDEIRQHIMDTKTPLLGEIVTWEIPMLETPYAFIRAALSAAGLPESAAKDLRTRTAFRRAIKDLHEGRAIDNVTTDRKSRVISFQFTRKHLLYSRLEFAYEAVCSLNVDSGFITCPDSAEIENHARTMFAHALAHRTTSDVTRLIQNLFANHADIYAINKSKGVAYFVPAQHRDFAARVEQFVVALNGTLPRFPVPKGTPEGNRAVKATIESGLTALAQELSDAVDAWDESTRTSTMDKAVARWQIIKHKAEAYSEYLGDRQTALLATLDEQRKRLAQKVNELMAAKQDAHPAPLFAGEAVNA